MKRIIRCLLSLVLLCLLLPSLSAFAEQSAEARGMEKLKTAVNRECVVLPEKESSSPTRSFRSVDLPAPFMPIIPTDSLSPA